MMIKTTPFEAADYLTTAAAQFAFLVEASKPPNNSEYVADALGIAARARGMDGETAPMMTYKEHMQWCKKRALEYVEQGDVQGGITSLMSDFTKHPETKHLTHDFGMLAIDAMQRGEIGARQFIEGFAE